MDRYPITKKGYDKLGEELKQLINIERKNIIKAISEAREHGDLSENAEYHAAKEKQALIEGKINDLQAKYNRAQIFDTSTITETKVTFGATVTLYDITSEEEKTIQIVGEYEADVDNGKISLISPLAKSLLGKEEGDEVKFTVPSGTKEFEILNVKYF